MTQLILERVDGVPTQSDKFSLEFERWLTALVDTLNSTIGDIEKNLNPLVQFGLSLPQYTTTQINALVTAGAPNGTLWYDTTLNHIQALVNGVVVTVA